MTRARVIGIGNRQRGDDAAGLLVTEALRGRLDPGVEVLQHDGDMLAVMDRLDGAGRVYLVDAADSGAEPGTLHRLDAHADSLPGGLGTLSSHGVGLAESLELARALGRLPRVCVILAIEGGCFEIGRPPSAAVRAAVPRAAEWLRRELGPLPVEGA